MDADFSVSDSISTIKIFPDLIFLIPSKPILLADSAIVRPCGSFTLSLYHYSIQLFPVEESCEIINCSSPYLWELGFISIPLMAFFNFFGLLLIIVNYKILSK